MAESLQSTKANLRPVLELDLDYLEDVGASRRRKRTTTPLQELSPDSVDMVKVIVLGASAVGKTSLIQQFVWQEFDEKYSVTEKKHTYYPSVIINDHCFELKLVDVPVIPFFPVNAYYEWTDYRNYGLRNATAYILVFDLSNVEETFNFIRTIFEQIKESRDLVDVPVVIVGNKLDLIESSSQKEIVTMVNEQLKQCNCEIIQCSAKFNWNVMYLFKRLMQMIDSTYTLTQQQEQQNIFEEISVDESKPKCLIL